jgi:DNA-directed RNA polymerase subunit beta
LEKAKIKNLDVPAEYVLGKVLAKTIINKDSGEILGNANDIITADMLKAFGDAKVKTFETLYINDIDHGSYMSDTLRVDPTNSPLEALVEIYRMMRPGEPPTKDAAETLFKNLFFAPERYDLSDVGRMKFNRRVGRTE